MRPQGMVLIVGLLGAIDGAWLAANLALGAVAVALAIRWARRSPATGAWVDALSGRALREAARELAELAELERI